ncbi:uncharacterized protein ACO6RY_09083 [Pungitius sinensis]
MKRRNGGMEEAAQRLARLLRAHSSPPERTFLLGFLHTAAVLYPAVGLILPLETDRCDVASSLQHLALAPSPT